MHCMIQITRNIVKSRSYTSRKFFQLSLNWFQGKKKKYTKNFLFNFIFILLNLAICTEADQAIWKWDVTVGDPFDISINEYNFVSKSIISY